MLDKQEEVKLSGRKIQSARMTWDGQHTIQIYDLKSEFNTELKEHYEYVLVSYKGKVDWLMLHSEVFFNSADNPFSNEIDSTPYIILDDNTVYGISGFDSINFNITDPQNEVVL